MNFKLTLIAVLLPLFMIGQNWQVVDVKDGITIEKDSINESDTYHFRATTKLKTSLKTLENLLENVSNYPNWLYNYEFAEVLERHDGICVFRAIISAPFPLRDRKLQMKLTKTVFDNKITYAMKSVPVSDASFCETCEEIPSITGGWEIKELPDQFTQLQNTTKVLIKVPLPKGLLYPLFYKAPQKSFMKLFDLYN